MRIRVVIVGLGNVGRRLVELLELKRELVRGRFDLEFDVVAVADSSGARPVSSPADLEELVTLKSQGKKLIETGPSGTVMELAQRAEAGLLVELSPTNLKTGEPGLSLIRAALERRMNVVTANKGPLVLGFRELVGTAQRSGAKLLFSATVTGGLPTLNLGRRDLGACEVRSFEGIVNATTNYILTRMGEGQSYETALRHAQEVGHAEADPSLDVDGWDAANKLVIIANAVLRRPTTLAEIEVVGIRGVTQDELYSAQAQGQVIKLVARAERVGGDFRFSVKPTWLDRNHPLTRVGAEMMGIIYHTDINGDIFASIEEPNTYPTAAAVLRDMINVYV